MKPPKNYIELKGFGANQAIAQDYRIMLNKLVRRMMKEVIPSILAQYKQIDYHKIVVDSPVDSIYNWIDIIFGKWQLYFNQIAPKEADLFTNEIDKNVTNRFVNSIKPIETISKTGFNAFKIRISENTKQLALAKEASIKENVNLITNLPSKAKEQIHQAVMSSITRGRDISYLRQELTKIDGLTKNRVRLIARDQSSKITSVLYTAKQANMGVKWAIWHHSHAGEVPRASHVKADGKKYEIDKGCYIDGEYIYPGEKINCRCYASSILPFEE